MFGTIQQFQKLTAGEQSWGEVGGGVDSGRIVGSGVFITVKSSVKDEAAIISDDTDFQNALFSSDKKTSAA
eukprot:CAMPEP_0179421842 /NCGR_PEP_ID=MMETSP0799-20121207/10053_1 /TAXON_ID=46947 /ORGANISM="Geminigera cryophila, Strain CCMP2564" /LENGTH=70 /DNA_ID=CAMNT_0021195819 /DNA_START=342 /DNA_END=554 /DNA_ORIENTATION=-